jgi:[NiFe] hydrogenase assembly HybE family chaperone
MGATARAQTPPQRLERAFRRIARTRMRDLPLLNRALHVEAVGFRAWQGQWLGALVTPWCINLVLLPTRRRSVWTPVAPGIERQVTFASGAYVFIGALEDGVGEYQTCSLFSPVFEFSDHAAACATARAALAELLRAAPPEQTVTEPEPPRLAGRLAQPLSKRDFLRRAFLREQP